MPDPASHAPDMISVIRVIRPSAMPRLWWLNPWAAAKYLHSAATALKAYADRSDRVIELQRAIVDDQSAEIRRLNLQIRTLADSREHWIKKHDVAYSVAMHNERVIAKLEGLNR